MRCLMDTNILLRWVQPDHELNRLVHAAVDALRDRDDDVFVATQNLVEFRCVATRPRDVNGLGMDPGQADTELRTLREHHEAPAGDYDARRVGRADDDVLLGCLQPGS